MFCFVLNSDLKMIKNVGPSVWGLSLLNALIVTQMDILMRTSHCYLILYEPLHLEKLSTHHYISKYNIEQRVDRIQTKQINECWLLLVRLEEHEDWKLIRSDGSAAVKSFIFTHYGVDSQFLCHLEKQETGKNWQTSLGEN